MKRSIRVLRKKKKKRLRENKRIRGMNEKGRVFILRRFPTLVTVASSLLALNTHTRVLSCSNLKGRRPITIDARHTYSYKMKALRKITLKYLNIQKLKYPSIRPQRKGQI